MNHKHWISSIATGEHDFVFTDETSFSLVIQVGQT